MWSKLMSPNQTTEQWCTPHEHTHTHTKMASPWCLRSSLTSHLNSTAVLQPAHGGDGGGGGGAGRQTSSTTNKQTNTQKETKKKRKMHDRKSQHRIKLNKVTQQTKVSWTFKGSDMMGCLLCRREWEKSNLWQCVWTFLTLFHLHTLKHTCLMSHLWEKRHNYLPTNITNNQRAS